MADYARTSSGNRGAPAKRRSFRKDSGQSRGRSEHRGNSGRGPRNSSFNRRSLQKTTVECASCKQSCEVPFKPTSNKPVYCDACFGKTSPKGQDYREEFDKINEKLDKIMKML